LATNFLFIRHGAHDLLGKRIAGRQPGVHLNSLGEQQAECLAERLSLLPIDAIYSGPLERVRETAAPICRQFNLPLEVAEEFTEVDFGDWTNCTFEALSAVPLWRQFNSFRSSTRPPHGELMLEIQARVLRKLAELRLQHQFVAIVSHGDVIRATLAHFLGVHLDSFHRLEIDPASSSLVEVGDDFVKVRLLNVPCEGAPLLLPAMRHQ
jgi:probable phosphoglycerate mutase